MKPATCSPFLDDLSAFVDGELSGTAGRRLVDHMERCSDCRGQVDSLRRLSGLHRHAASALDRALAARVDSSGLLASLTANLVADKRGALARLFYEVGKAYVVRGNRELEAQRRQSVAVCAPPVEIRPAEMRSRRIAQEAADLDAASPVPARDGRDALLRSRRLLGARQTDSDALERGRRFLEEALALQPGLDEAGLWLAFQQAASGRPERARRALIRIRRTAADPSHRLMAVQGLGRLAAEAGDHAGAVAHYEEVVKDPSAAVTSELFPSFLNLAVNYCKVGRVREAGEHFAALLWRFPDRSAQIRDLLRRKPAFAALLERDPALRQALALHAPLLFAA